MAYEATNTKTGGGMMKKLRGKKYGIIALRLLFTLTLVLALAVPTVWAEGPKPLRVVIDNNYPPYSFLDAEGNPQGVSIDQWRLFGEKTGIPVEISALDWSEALARMQRGEADVIDTIFYNEERAKIYDFTKPYVKIEVPIFFNKNITGITGMDSLKGFSVAAKEGDNAVALLKSAGVTDIKLFKSYEAILQAAKDQTVTIFVVDKPPALYYLYKLQIQDEFNYVGSLNSGEFHRAVHEGDAQLLKTLEQGFAQISAAEYNKIDLKWYGNSPANAYDLMRAFYGVGIIGLGVLVVLLVWSATLKRAVTAKTQALVQANTALQTQQEELTAANEEMEASMEELMAIEEELRSQYERLIESEGNLRASEELNHAILDAIPDLIFVFDRNGRYINCLAGEDEDLKLPKAAVIGRYISDVAPAPIAERAVYHICQALDTGRLQRFEYDLEISGEQKTFEMRIARCRADEVLGIARNITEERLNQQRVEFLSYHDQLTGVYNRRFFEEELARLDTPENLPLCIVMADVNGLKLINDSFGHKAGDELLVKVAEIIKQACCHGEVVSRIGGDEFVILLPATEAGRAEELIRQIKEISDGESVASVDISVSYGYEVKHSAEQDIDEIFNRAEDSMYKRKLFEGPSMRGKTIGAIINTLHEKNQREELHSHRVSELSQQLAAELNLSDREIGEIKTVGLLHDIGKIAIHESILNKPARLTTEEWEEMQRHSEIGYRILSSVNDMAEMADYVLSHHERWDGSGYPQGLKEEAIPLQSRMIAIADAFDAMTSERSYQPPKTEDEAVKELLKHAGTQFDPALVRLFVEEVLEYEGEDAIEIV